MNIKTQDLTKTYTGPFRNPIVALDHVSLSIETGMFGLLGPNGAGKTTLMRILATLLKPTSGHALVGEFKTHHPSDKWHIRKRLGYLPQEMQMYNNLSAREFLTFVCALKQTPHTQIEKILELTGLTEMAKRKIKSYSGGMKRRLGIAQALIGNPQILIIDEPTTGLDPQERTRFRNLLVELAHNRTILLSSHITEDIAHTCPNVAILNHGQLRFCGTTQSLLQIVQEYVWEFTSPHPHPPHDLHIVATTQTPNGMHYRVLANSKPTQTATPATPTVEDAYLWLLHHTQQ